MSKRKAAIIGSGNIGTDLMIKILRHGVHLEMAVMVGIDPESDGLARARRMGVATTHEGVTGLIAMPEFADIDIVFDATSAGAHVKNDAALRAVKPGIRLIDLPGLDLVIHADLPTNSETLLHRSGRTGRAGRKGTSVLVVPQAEFRKANRLLQGAKLVAEWGKAPGAEELQAREDARRLLQQ